MVIYSSILESMLFLLVFLSRSLVSVVVVYRFFSKLMMFTMHTCTDTKREINSERERERDSRFLMVMQSHSYSLFDETSLPLNDHFHFIENTYAMNYSKPKQNRNQNPNWGKSNGKAGIHSVEIWTNPKHTYRQTKNLPPSKSLRLLLFSLFSLHYKVQIHFSSDIRKKVIEFESTFLFVSIVIGMNNENGQTMQWTKIVVLIMADWLIFFLENFNIATSLDCKSLYFDRSRFSSLFPEIQCHSN